MWWELGLVDLEPVPRRNGGSYRGASYEQYAAFYHLEPETVEYARARARETGDIILRIHYLEFVLLRSEPRGRPWIELQREILQTYRDFVDGCRAAGNDRFVGIYIGYGLTRIGQLLGRRGLVRPADLPAWAEWILKLAEDSRSFPAESAAWAVQQRHRWVADYFAHLTALPADAVAPPLRARALTLLADAAAYYETTPLNDHFEHHVAEVEANLRKHWGEHGTHERMIRRQFEVTLRRAEFHKRTGEGLVTAIFFRQARALVEQQRQYFTAADVSRLERAEQEALDLAVARGEFKRLRVTIEVPKELMDYVRETPEATVQAIFEEATVSVPNRAKILEDVHSAAKSAPLHGMLPRTVVGSGKVVGESRGEEGNVALDVEERAMLATRLTGTGVADGVIKGARDVGLTADHLLAPLAPLHLDEGTMALIRHGCERFIAEDFISATHILVLRFEDAFRHHLKAVGVDTTEFQRDGGDGTTRTDDATLGSLMRKTLPDGTSAKDYLGNDLWEHWDSVLNSQTGLNLRNEFAHGLARPQHCVPGVAGIALVLLYQLAGVASRTSSVRTS